MSILFTEDVSGMNLFLSIVFYFRTSSAYKNASLDISFISSIVGIRFSCSLMSISV